MPEAAEHDGQTAGGDCAMENDSMTAPDRMSPERIEDVIEEIATTLRRCGNDDKGLHTLTLTLIRPEGNRLLIPYFRDADPSSQPKAGT
jgi:hypothetical protein